ncbi:hypothetical protein MTO96_018324 [Rhipicephalus appendiculatus]
MHAQRSRCARCFFPPPVAKGSETASGWPRETALRQGSMAGPHQTERTRLPDQGQSARVSHSGERRRFLARQRSPGHEPRRRNFSNTYPEKAMPKIGDARSGQRDKENEAPVVRQNHGVYSVRGEN